VNKDQASKKINAIEIARATTVGIPTGGSVDVAKGDVLLVPNEVSNEDAVYLVAMGKAKSCDPKLKAQKARATAGDK